MPTRQRKLPRQGDSFKGDLSAVIWALYVAGGTRSNALCIKCARHRYSGRTRAQAKADVFDYIERFYNPRRRHSTLGYLSPMEFEMRAGLA